MFEGEIKQFEGARFLALLLLFTMTVVAALYTLNCCATQKLYKLSFSDCVISTKSTLADAMHLISENHPSKIGDDESLQRCTVGRERVEERGRGGRAAAAAATSHSSSCSVFGASSGSLGFVSFSSLPVFISDSLNLLCCFFLSIYPSTFFSFLSHPLFILPYMVFGLSQGLNLWLWSYRNIGMTTHALLGFVS